MNRKVIILILNALYLIVAVSWAISNTSFETVLAVIGGFVSFATFFVANDNSFSVTIKKNISQKAGDNAKQKIVGGNYYEK